MQFVLQYALGDRRREVLFDDRQRADNAARFLRKRFAGSSPIVLPYGKPAEGKVFTQSGDLFVSTEVTRNY